MAGLFTRVKTWLKLETLKAADINAEFDNVITNFIPTKIDDYSASVAQMRTETDPGGVGTESQATSTAGEIERLRYAIRRALGTTYWYENPGTSLATIQALLSASALIPTNSIQSGTKNSDNQPSFLVPDTGSNANVRLKATTTPLVVYINNNKVTISADLTLALSGPSAFTTLVNDSSLSGQSATFYQGEYGASIPVDTATGSAPTLGTYQAWKVGSTEYFYGMYESATVISNCKRGLFFNTSAAGVPRLALSDNNTITLCRAAYIFLTYVSSTPALAVTYNKPTVSNATPTGATSGDWWLDLNTGIWKVFNGATFNDGTGIFVGIAVVDSTNCVAARSADFDYGFSSINTFSLEKIDGNTVRSLELGSKVNVYGVNLDFKLNHVSWVMPTDLEAGQGDSISSVYYLYLTREGVPKISGIVPHERRWDLFGHYHPHKPWRCVGVVKNDASGNFEAPYDTGTDLVKAQLRATAELTSTLATTTSMTALTGASQTIFCTGKRPVWVGLLPIANTGSSTSLGCVQDSATIGASETNSTIAILLKIFRGTTEVASFRADAVGRTQDTGVTILRWPPGCFYTIDETAPFGEQTYTVQGRTLLGTSTDTLLFQKLRLVAIEMGIT